MRDKVLEMRSTCEWALVSGDGAAGTAESPAVRLERSSGGRREHGAADSETRDSGGWGTEVGGGEGAEVVGVGNEGQLMPATDGARGRAWARAECVGDSGGDDCMVSGGARAGAVARAVAAARWALYIERDGHGGGEEGGGEEGGVATRWGGDKATAATAATVATSKDVGRGSGPVSGLAAQQTPDFPGRVKIEFCKRAAHTVHITAMRGHTDM